MSVWSAFTSIPNGTKIENHGFDQCVALANHYNENFLGNPFVPVAAAYQWWSLFPSLSQLRDNFKQSGSPVAGALFVARYGNYDAPNGHIGVVTFVHADGTFDTMEQNAENHQYTYRYRRSMANTLGFLIPNNNPATNTAPWKDSDMAFESIRHPNGTIIFIDELGTEGVDAYRSSDIGASEYLETFGKVFGGAKQVTAREFDIARAIANRRRAAIEQRQANLVLTSLQAQNEAAIKKALEAALKGGVNVDAAALAKTIAKTVNDDFAARLSK